MRVLENLSTIIINTSVGGPVLGKYASRVDSFSNFISDLLCSLFQCHLSLPDGDSILCSSHRRFPHFMSRLEPPSLSAQVTVIDDLCKLIENTERKGEGTVTPPCGNFNKVTLV